VQAQKSRENLKFLILPFLWWHAASHCLRRALEKLPRAFPVAPGPTETQPFLHGCIHRIPPRGAAPLTPPASGLPNQAQPHPGGRRGPPSHAAHPPGSAACAVQGERGPADQGDNEQQDPALGQLAGSVESCLSEALMSMPACRLLFPRLTAPRSCTPSPFILMDAVAHIAFAGISVPPFGLL